MKKRATFLTNLSKNKVLGLLYIFILGTFISQAQVPTDPVKIWGGKGPGSESLTIEESLNSRTPTGDCDLDRTASNITEPELVPFTPTSPNGTAVIICPGGGYESLTYDVEGVDIAEWLNTLGITAFILKYRLPVDGHNDFSDVPLQDAQRALRLIRYNANSWGLESNQIGIIGFSAGGHVASSLGTGYDKSVYSRIDDVDDVSARPDFMMLLYALISMENAITHDGARENLLGGSITTELINEYSTDKHVNSNTPVAFIACAVNDGSVDPDNSSNFNNAMQSAGVSSELHIYDDGGHGKGICRASNTTDFKNWTTHCATWLADLDFGTLSAKNEQKNSLDSDFTAFYNASSKHLVIDYSTHKAINGSIRINIFDISGKKVASEEIVAAHNRFNHKHEFDFSKEKYGVYVIKILNGNEVKSKKLIIHP